MKFIETIQTDITWLTVTGTMAELNKCVAWINKNRTMYVIEGKLIEDTADLSNWQVFQLKKQDAVPMKRRFGFKAKSDALRFKLSMA